MEREVYQRMQQLETRHWWFVARRQILSEILQRLVRPPRGARLMEAGCGTGGNLEMLSGFGTVDAFEYDAEARAIACRRFGAEIPFGALPAEIPFEKAAYDVVALFDVLEHIEADVNSLAALRACLRPGGAIVLSVPAFPQLWSAHDKAHHHFRRYTKASLEKVARQAGLRVERSFYFNSFLFPIAVGMRKVKAVLGLESPDDTMPSGPVNAVLRMIFASERHLIGRLSMPLGLSLAAVLRLEADG